MSLHISDMVYLSYLVNEQPWESGARTLTGAVYIPTPGNGNYLIRLLPESCSHKCTPMAPNHMYMAIDSRVSLILYTSYDTSMANSCIKLWVLCMSILEYMLSSFIDLMIACMLVTYSIRILFPKRWRWASAPLSKWDPIVRRIHIHRSWPLHY